MVRGSDLYAHSCQNQSDSAYFQFLTALRTNGFGSTIGECILLKIKIIILQDVEYHRLQVFPSYDRACGRRTKQVADNLECT